MVPRRYLSTKYSASPFSPCHRVGCAGTSSPSMSSSPKPASNSSGSLQSASRSSQAPPAAMTACCDKVPDEHLHKRGATCEYPDGHRRYPCRHQWWYALFMVFESTAVMIVGAVDVAAGGGSPQASPSLTEVFLVDIPKFGGGVLCSMGLVIHGRFQAIVPLYTYAVSGCACNIFDRHIRCVAESVLQPDNTSENC